MLHLKVVFVGKQQLCQTKLSDTVLTNCCVSVFNRSQLIFGTTCCVSIFSWCHFALWDHLLCQSIQLVSLCACGLIALSIYSTSVNVPLIAFLSFSLCQCIQLVSMFLWLRNYSVYVINSCRYSVQIRF